MKMTLTELDCLTIFESEPDREFGDDWFGSSNLYQIRYPNGLRLNCAVHPIHRDIRVTISLEETSLADIEFLGVENIQYNEKPLESLTIFDKNSSMWQLTVKPFPAIILTTRETDG